MLSLRWPNASARHRKDQIALGIIIRKLLYFVENFMSDQRRLTGRQGEALAAMYLQRHGYGIIAKNWRCALGELDLIAIDQTTLVFVEVRTRRSAIAGLAEESVTLAKRRRLSALADAYLQHRANSANPWLGPWRIDVVAVHIGADGLMRLRHLQHAVEAC